MSTSTSAKDEKFLPDDFDLSQIFIAREHQLNLFEIYLDRWKQQMSAAQATDTLVTSGPSPNNKIQGLVVMLYGRGGFGKSTLLKRYCEKALEERWKFKVSKIVDWEFAVEGKRSIFNAVSGQEVDAEDYFRLLWTQLTIALERRADDFKEYQAAVRAVEEAKKQVVSALESMQKDDRSGSFYALAGPAAVALLRWIAPRVGQVLDAAQVTQKVEQVVGKGAEIGAEQLVQLHGILRDKLGARLGDSLEPALRLGLALGRDLRQFARNFPLLIFFDTYEEVDEADRLLRLVMAAAGLRVGWVLAGRDNLWAGLEQSERSVDVEYGYRDIVSLDRGLSLNFNAGDVGAFTGNDIAEYFAQLRQRVQSQPPLPAVDQKGAARILKVTQGVPLAVKIAAGLFLESPRPDLDIITEKVDGQRTIVDQMVRRYLLHTRADQAERSRLYGLALLRRADRPTAIAAALALQPEQAETRYQAELSRLHRRYSFIFTEKAQPSLHQEVRHFMRLWLLEHRSEPEIRAANIRLKESHEATLKDLEEQRRYANLQMRMEDDEWVETYLDLTEQQFWLDSALGVLYAIPFLLAGSIYHPEAALEVTEIGKFFEAIIKQPYRTWWEWASRSLVRTGDSWFYRSPRTVEKLLVLQELERLAQQHGQAFSFPRIDCRAELEGALWWRLGEAHRDADDYNTSFEWYEKALSRLDGLPELKEATAEAYRVFASRLSKEHRPAGERLFFLNRVIELRPHSAQAYLMRGNAYRGLREYQRAIEDFTCALTLDPSYALAYNNRGLVYNVLKDYHRAIEDFDHAIVLNPNNAYAYDNRGKVYLDLENYRRALEDLDHALKLDPSLANALVNRGYAYEKLKEDQRAVADYTRAITLLNTALRQDPKDVEAYRNRGYAYNHLKEHQLAIEDYTRVMALDPDEAHDYNSRGWAYEKMKDYRLAIEDYTRAMALDPDDAEVYVSRGWAFHELKEYRQAIEDFDRAIALDPDYAMAYNNRGLAYYYLKDYQRAIEDSDRAIALDPNLTWPINNRGLVSLALKEYQQAIEDFDRAIALDPDYAMAYNNRGNAYYSLKEYQRAIEDYERAMEHDPDLALPHNNLGLVYDALKQYQRAIEDFTRAIELDPGDANFYISRGWTHYHLEEYEQAIEDFDRAIVLDPDQARIYRLRARVYNELKQYQRAIEDFDRAIELDPNDDLAYWNRGWSYNKLKQYQRAIEDFDRAIELDPEYALACNNRGWSYKELKEYQRAIEDYDRAIALDPDDANSYLNQGICYRELNHYQRAIEDFDRAITLDPDDSYIYYQRGLAYIGLEQHQRAIEDFDLAIALDPDYTSAYNARGVAYENLEQYQQAIGDYEHAITLNSNYVTAYNNRASVCCKIKEYQRAIEDFDRAIALDPNSVELYEDRAGAYEFLEDYGQAIEDYGHAIALDPEYARAYNKRALLYLKLEEYQRAIADFDHVITLVSTYADAYRNRGWAYKQLEQYERAIEDFDRAIALDSENANTYNNRGHVYSQLDQCQLAIEDFDRAIALDPNFVFPHFNRGWAYYVLGDYQRAIEDFDRTLALDSNYALAYFRRALAYLGLKNTERAYSDFCHYQKLEPDDVNAAWMAEWSRMGQHRPGLEVAERLEKIVAVDSQPENEYITYVCRGVASGLRGELREGLAELKRAITINPQEWDAFFWKGMLCAYFYEGRHQMAVEALEQALAIGLPPVLLTPLHWLEAERPYFYERHGKPLLERFEV